MIAMARQRGRFCAATSYFVFLGLYLSIANASNLKATMDASRRLLEASPEFAAEPVMGDPLKCEFLVIFDEQVSDVDAALQSTTEHILSGETLAAATSHLGLQYQLPFHTVFGRARNPSGEPWREGNTPGTSVISSSVQQDGRFIAATLLKPLCVEAPGGAELLNKIAGAPDVMAIVPNTVVATAAGSEPCLSPAGLASAYRPVSASVSWPGCYGAVFGLGFSRERTSLVWWGRRCDGDPDRMEWLGVKAVSTTGRAIPGCEKERRNLTGDEAALWLGSCGVPPAVSPNTPVKICTNPPPAAACLAPIKPTTKFSFTVSMMHPVPECGGGQPIRMTFTGRSCGATGWQSLLLWDSATPAKGEAGIASAAKCKITRRQVGIQAASFYSQPDREWLGLCGVPPVKLRGVLPVCALPRGTYSSLESPSPPPVTPASPAPPPASPPPLLPPSPPPSPRLVMEDVKAGEAVSDALLRIKAVTSDNQVPAESNWDLGKPAAVAVVDTGILCSHPDLNVVYQWKRPELSPGDGCFDPNGHGTHVAGLIGARNNGQGIIGTAPGVPLLSFRALNSNGKATTAEIVAAVNAVLDFAPPPDKPAWAPTVINLSLTSLFSYDPGHENQTLPQTVAALCLPYKKLAQAGITPVAAAGNADREFMSTPDRTQQLLPAACEHVIAVTAVSTHAMTPQPEDGPAVFDGNPASGPTPKSNYAWGVNPEARKKTLAAPGYQLTSTMNPGATTIKNSKDPSDGGCSPGPASSAFPFCALSGTSQAAALVSGLVARCYASGACSRSMTNSERLEQIVGTARAFNLDHMQFGFQSDAVRASPDSELRYYGYLVWGGAWDP